MTVNSANWNFWLLFQSFHNQTFKSSTVRHAFGITGIVRFNPKMMLPRQRSEPLLQPPLSSDHSTRALASYFKGKNPLFLFQNRKIQWYTSIFRLITQKPRTPRNTKSDYMRKYIYFFFLFFCMSFFHDSLR